MKHLTYILLALTLQMACKTERRDDVEEQNTYEVLNLLAKKAVAGHPFYTGFNKNFNIREHLINDKFLVVVDSVMRPVRKTMSLKDRYKKEYGELFKKLKNIDRLSALEIERIKSYQEVDFIKMTKKHRAEIKKRCDFRNFHQFVNFSRISFSSNYDKAILGFGNATSCLAGEYGLCLLKKEQGKWKVYEYIITEIS